MPDNPDVSPHDDDSTHSVTEPGPKGFWTEDLLAIVLGWLILGSSLTAGAIAMSNASELNSDTKVAHPFVGWFAKPGGWTDSPAQSFIPAGKAELWPGVLTTFALIAVLFSVGVKIQGQCSKRFLRGFIGVFSIATLAYVLAGQSFVKQYNLEYALWALAGGLLISNTIGTPKWMRPALKTEFFVKTGLVLLGGEILMSKLMALGVPGVFVAWVVTPIVLVTTYWFGQKILRMPSKSLNMVISSDMSVCGVSAAIASAAACKAKKEELSLAIGMSLSFTVVMMVVMPALIRSVGMDEQLGGAWMGGTIDATGAVAAAGEFLGEEALQVAALVKMIQNILIGVVAFGIAVYWTTVVEKSSQPNSLDTSSGTQLASQGIREIWKRFPKFILGFIIASIACSMLHGWMDQGPSIVESSIKSCTKILRGWLFCLAFVSIGLETNFRDLAKHLAGGKPVLLYVAGQSLNLVLTLAMAYLMFKVVFAE